MALRGLPIWGVSQLPSRGDTMTDLTRIRRLADLADAGHWLIQERDTEIRRLRSEGMTVAELVTETGLTRQRVHQIIDKEEGR